jgi:hypothetical protein
VLVFVVLAGLNTAVTPFGNTLVVKLTVPANPFSPLTLIVLAPLPPLAIVRIAADAERLKLGTVTVTAIVVVLLRVPEVPVTVIG